MYPNLLLIKTIIHPLHGVWDCFMHSPYTCWLCIFSKIHHVRHHHPAHYYYYPGTATPRALHIPVLPHSTELTQCTQYIGHPLNIVNHHTQLTIPFSIYIANAHTYRLRYTHMQLIPLISTDTQDLPMVPSCFSSHASPILLVFSWCSFWSSLYILLRDFK